MNRRGLLSLLTAAAFGAMLNVFPAFAPEPKLCVLTLSAGIRQDFIDAFRKSYDDIQQRLAEGCNAPT